MSKPRARKFYGNLTVSRCMLMSSPFWLAAAASQELRAVDYFPTDVASLRAAITASNTSGVDDVIELATGTYTLAGAILENANASGDLDITKSSNNLVIRAATSAAVTISGGFNDRVFHINASGATISIEGISIVNGLAYDDGSGLSEARGGGILLEQGSLTLTDVSMSSNYAAGISGSSGSFGGGAGGNGAAARGGAIYVAGGSLQIDASNITNNLAFGGDGGFGGTGLSSSSFAFATGGNGGVGGTGGQAQGGGLHVAGGTVNVGTTTIANNSAVGGSGGSGGNGGFASAIGSNYASAFGGTGGSGGSGGAGEGGGIFIAAAANVTLDASTVSQNGVVPGSGGAGGGGGAASASASGSTFEFGGNGGSGGAGGFAAGGGIHVAGGALVAINSTVSSNGAAGGTGGSGGDGGSGAYSNGFGGNGGDGGGSHGGGISISTGSLGLNNSTVAQNISSEGPGGSGGSGTSSGSAGNSGTTSGGGVFNIAGTVTLNSSIVAGNDDNTASNDTEDLDGTVTAGATLFQTNPSGSVVTAGTGANIAGQDPLLGALQNNGGLTETHAIGSTSPARNVGTNPLSQTTDQRGLQRDDGNGVDMGSFEFGATAGQTASPIVTNPAAPVTVDQATFMIQGTAAADSFVRVYSDANDDGVVNGVDAVVNSQQLTGGGTTYSISVALTQDAANNFIVTADDATNPESNPVNVPTITDDDGSGGSDGGGDDGSSCSTTETMRPGWLAIFAALAAMLAGVRSAVRRRRA
jgi:hypothetical protein